MGYTWLKAAARMAAIVVVLLLAPRLATAQTPDSSDINDLLKQVKIHAALAEDDASTLESYSFSRISPGSHANRLEQVKDHANDLIVEFNKLGELRPFGSVWQQEAIDRIQPLVRQISSHLTMTIDHYSENQSQVNMPQYREYVRTNRQFISKASRLISDFVDYGETKAKTEALEKSLSLPTIAQETR